MAKNDNTFTKSKDAFASNERLSVNLELAISQFIIPISNQYHN